MTYVTFATLESDVRSELGLIDEPIVTQAELISAANTAVEKAEKQLLTLYEDYYKTYAAISLVSGTKRYSLPTDIHGVKIRGIMYNDGSDVYAVKRLRGPKLFEKIADLETNSVDGDDYVYDIENTSAATGMKLVLYPTPQETSATVMKMWYIRKALKITAPSSVIDVPEGYQYVKACVKFYAAAKEPGIHDMVALKQDIEEQFEQMTSTLADKVPDEDNMVPMDTSFYDDHV
jgi:hypothetical protein